MIMLMFYATKELLSTSANNCNQKRSGKLFSTLLYASKEKEGPSRAPAPNFSLGLSSFVAESTKDNHLPSSLSLMNISPKKSKDIM